MTRHTIGANLNSGDVVEVTRDLPRPPAARRHQCNENVRRSRDVDYPMPLVNEMISTKAVAMGSTMVRRKVWCLWKPLMRRWLFFIWLLTWVMETVITFTDSRVMSRGFSCGLILQQSPSYGGRIFENWVKNGLNLHFWACDDVNFLVG